MPDASHKDLRKSYQELALRYHPDKLKPDVDVTCPEMFIKVNQAWVILGDPVLREQYDVRWKERCLTQMYPIHDSINFKEFEVISPEVTNICPIVDKETKFAENDSDKDNFTKNDILKSVFSERSMSHSFHNKDLRVDSTLAENNFVQSCLSSGENLSNKTSGYHTPEKMYSFTCRCGGSYILTEIDVKLKFDIVCCDTCSLSIEVVYNNENST